MKYKDDVAGKAKFLVVLSKESSAMFHAYKSSPVQNRLCTVSIGFNSSGDLHQACIVGIYRLMASGGLSIF